jgi:7-cyano-7-deazaguanine synthase
MGESPKAIVLLSGGLDSATTLAVARAEERACYALTMVYGQRCRTEVEAARRIGEAMKVAEHRIIELDPRALGGSALTGESEIPKSDPPVGGPDRIPATYVPLRNILFLSYGSAWAEAVGAGEVFIGANAIDYSGYPDCRPEFIEAYQKVLEVGTRAGVEGDGIKVRAPLIDLPKHEIIRRGLELGVDYSLTVSCYEPAADGAACGRCESCRLRLKAFAELGCRDPIRYAC